MFLSTLISTGIPYHLELRKWYWVWYQAQWNVCFNQCTRICNGSIFVIFEGSPPLQMYMHPWPCWRKKIVEGVIFTETEKWCIHEITSQTEKKPLQSRKIGSHEFKWFHSIWKKISVTSTEYLFQDFTVIEYMCMWWGKFTM